MKKNVKYLDIFNSQETFDKLFKTDFDALTTLKLRKFHKQYLEHLQDIEEIRNKVIKKYGKQEGDMLYIDPQDTEAIKKYTEEITPVMNTEVEIENYDIKISDLKNFKCSVKDLVFLELFFENDLEEEVKK